MTENEEFTLRFVELNTQTVALTHLVAILATRMANQYDDPDNFIMTLTAPLDALAEGFDPSDLMGAAASGAVMDLQNRVESIAQCILHDE